MQGSITSKKVVLTITKKEAFHTKQHASSDRGAAAVSTQHCTCAAMLLGHC